MNLKKKMMAAAVFGMVIIGGSIITVKTQVSSSSHQKSSISLGAVSDAFAGSIYCYDTSYGVYTPNQPSGGSGHCCSTDSCSGSGCTGGLIACTDHQGCTWSGTFCSSNSQGQCTNGPYYSGSTYYGSCGGGGGGGSDE